jgi:hypothetical protein
MTGSRSLVAQGHFQQKQPPVIQESGWVEGFSRQLDVFGSVSSTAPTARAWWRVAREKERRRSGGGAKKRSVRPQLPRCRSCTEIAAAGTDKPNTAAGEVKKTSASWTVDVRGRGWGGRSPYTHGGSLPARPGAGRVKLTPLLHQRLHGQLAVEGLDDHQRQLTPAAPHAPVQADALGQRRAADGRHRLWSTRSRGRSHRWYSCAPSAWLDPSSLSACTVTRMVSSLRHFQHGSHGCSSGGKESVGQPEGSW